ncbi:HAD family hydrolase [Candidatus Woesearchaeota archaeon]|nr:HAD family hydrolase [Candidatus Woesearchaeota archaeon]
MIKVLFFDFWGTLVENGVWSPIKQVKTILGIKDPFSEYVVKMEKAMMTRSFSSLREAFQALCVEFNVSCTEENLDLLVGMWNKSWMLAKPYEEVVEVLQQLTQDYTLVLVSNTDCFSINSVLEKYALKQYFEKIVFSCEIGKIKTDEDFFPTVLRELQVSPEECLMVGDSLQSDIEPAERVGMHAVLVDRKNSREHGHKISSLRELEKKIGELQ